MIIIILLLQQILRWKIKPLLIYKKEILSEIIELGTCPRNNFRCKNKRCIQSSRVCNGEDDCLDNSDEEEGCQGKLFPCEIQYSFKPFGTMWDSNQSEFFSYFASLGTKCPSHAFLCANNKCISAEKVCDRKSDCDDNSDESTICTGMTYHSQ